MTVPCTLPVALSYLLSLAVEIVSNAAFTSSSRLSEGTSLGLGNRSQRFQVFILFMILHLRSAALSLSYRYIYIFIYMKPFDVLTDHIAS